MSAEQITPSSRRRRSIRLKGYDYTSEGGYFITIVTHNRQPLFGGIIDGEMHLNDLGTIAREEWFHTAQMRPYIEIFDDEFVVMPDHIHGIIWITDLVGVYTRDLPVNPDIPNKPVGAYCNTPLQGNTPLPTRSFHSPGIGIGAIIRGYKSAVTKRVNLMLNTPSSPLWQRNYYEHIITTDREYESIIEYIHNNPLNWALDQENPDHL